MTQTVIWTVAILAVLGLLLALVLFWVASRFKVEEDPRIDLVQAVLPGANCGGCGFAGCRNFAEACVKAGSIEGLACPVGGEPTMDEVKKIIAGGGESAATGNEPVAAGGEKKGFDPAIAAKIKALATPRAVYPNVTSRAQKCS